MLAEIDLFDLYRWLLAIICAVYTLVVTGRSLFGWLAYFRSSRHTLVLGRYAAVLLLRTRLRRFAWELCQITLLLVLLGYVVYLHGHLPREM